MNIIVPVFSERLIRMEVFSLIQRKLKNSFAVIFIGKTLF